MNEKFPCVNCISLPICKPIALKVRNSTSPQRILISKLISRCDLMRNYVGEIVHTNINARDLINEMHTFFKTPHISEGKDDE